MGVSENVRSERGLECRLKRGRGGMRRMLWEQLGAVKAGINKCLGNLISVREAKRKEQKARL